MRGPRKVCQRGGGNSTPKTFFLCVYLENINLILAFIITIISQPIELLKPQLSPHFTKDYFGPESTRSIFLVGRPHICETIGDLRAITDNHLRRSGKVWRNRLSPTRVGYRKNDRLLFLNMFKNSSRSKTVGCWSSWSSEGPLKVALSRLPSGAFVYPLELSSTLVGGRDATVALPAWIVLAPYRIVEASWAFVAPPWWIVALPSWVVVDP